MFHQRIALKTSFGPTVAISPSIVRVEEASAQGGFRWIGIRSSEIGKFRKDDQAQMGKADGGRSK
jgi:hypothetical protein